MPASATTNPTTSMPPAEYMTMRFWSFLAKLWSAMRRVVFYPRPVALASMKSQHEKPAARILVKGIPGGMTS